MEKGNSSRVGSLAIREHCGARGAVRAAVRRAGAAHRHHKCGGHLKASQTANRGPYKGAASPVKFLKVSAGVAVQAVRPPAPTKPTAHWHTLAEVEPEPVPTLHTRKIQN